MLSGVPTGAGPWWSLVPLPIAWTGFPSRRIAISSSSVPGVRISVSDRQLLVRSGLEAASGRGHGLARVAEPLGVPDVAHAGHLDEVGLVEEVLHVRDLLD